MVERCEEPLFYHVFSDQLWNFTNDSKLKNKGGIWQFSNTQWTLPLQGIEAVIETKNSSKVLGIDNLTPKSGSVVLLESLDTKKSDVQKWIVEQSDEQGWFTITNPKSRLILTAQKSDKPAKVKGRRAKCFIYRTRAIITRGLYTFYPIFEFHCGLYYRPFMY